MRNFSIKKIRRFLLRRAWTNLKRVSFHEKLGSLYDKQERVSVIAQILANEFDLSKQEKDALNRASEIFKFDLVTNTVIEFTKLQGKIGAILAKEKGEKELVGDAISEQYLPSSATSELPSTKVGTVLSLADKLDTLIMFFAIGQVPTGSNDPFALRRQAMGICANDRKLWSSFLTEKFNESDRRSFEYQCRIKSWCCSESKFGTGNSLRTV